MFRLLPIAAASLSLLAGAAAANAASPPAAQNAKVPSYAAPVIADANAMKAADELHHTSIRQQLQGQLEKAGYTDVKIMPSSFYIQAKDKKGEPIAMVVGPDTFVEVSEVGKTPGASAQQIPKAGDAQPMTKPTVKQQ